MTKEELLQMQDQAKQQTEQAVTKVEPAIIIGLVPKPDGTQALAIQNNMASTYEALYILEMARDLLKMQVAQGQSQKPSRITHATGRVTRV